MGQVDGDFNGANVIALLGAVVNQRYGLRHLRSVVGLPATGLLKAPDFSQELPLIQGTLNYTEQIVHCIQYETCIISSLVRKNSDIIS